MVVPHWTANIGSILCTPLCVITRVRTKISAANGLATAKAKMKYKEGGSSRESAEWVRRQPSLLFRLAVWLHEGDGTQKYCPCTWYQLQ